MTAQKSTPEEQAAKKVACQRAYYAEHKEEINARNRARRQRKKLEQSGRTGRGE